jgi:Transglycosylase SLT domain
MADYSFAQLEGLWIQAGGSKALAPLMAGVAEVESGGNPRAYNPSGASGLWQIEIPLHSNLVPGGAGNVFNPLDNAIAAVRLSGNTLAGITSNWLDYEPPGAAAAIAKENGGTVPAAAGTAATTSATSATDPLGVGSILGGATGLLKDVATALDYVFGLFGRGQGWRIVFTAAALAALLGAYKALGGWTPSVAL